MRYMMSGKGNDARLGEGSSHSGKKRADGVGDAVDDDGEEWNTDWDKATEEEKQRANDWLETFLKDFNKDGTFGMGEKARLPLLKRLIVTGFGKFDGKSNPTEKLVGRDAKLNAVDGALNPLSDFLGGVTVEGHVLQVSVDAVNDFFEGREIWCGPAEVCVHFGVHHAAKQFRLESCAYNECEFKRPDVLGNNLSGVPVSDIEPFKCVKKSEVSLDEMCGELQSRGHDCVVSDDPGRYLCNYIYYKSLARGATSIFIHVPPFETISEEKQTAFVADLFRLLLERVCKKKLPKVYK